jgi:hypothetical protein
VPKCGKRDIRGPRKRPPESGHRRRRTGTGAPDPSATEGSRRNEPSCGDGSGSGQRSFGGPNGARLTATKRSISEARGLLRRMKRPLNASHTGASESLRRQCRQQCRKLASPPIPDESDASKTWRRWWSTKSVPPALPTGAARQAQRPPTKLIDRASLPARDQLW